MKKIFKIVLIAVSVLLAISFGGLIVCYMVTLWQTGDFWINLFGTIVASIITLVLMIGVVYGAVSIAQTIPD